jgi:hypothetical protein
LKIGLAITKRSRDHQKVVLLSGAKDLLLHFHGLGRNTLPCLTALKIASPRPGRCHPEAKPKDRRLYFHISGWNTVRCVTAVAFHCEAAHVFRSNQ